MKKQAENEYDCKTPKAEPYDTVNPLFSDQKPVTVEMDPAYQLTMLVNQTSGDHPPEYEIIEARSDDDDDVNADENPAYAVTQFKWAHTLLCTSVFIIIWLFVWNFLQTCTHATIANNIVL